MYAIPTNYHAYRRYKSLPIVVSADKSHPQGLFSHHIFGVTEEEKTTKAALIELNTYVMRPIFLSAFRTINRKIVSCLTTRQEHFIRAGVIDIVDDNYIPEDSDIRGYGPMFLYTNWNALNKKQWVQEIGKYSNKEMKLSMTKFPREHLFKDHHYVVPIAYRDEDTETGILEKDINKYLADIINYSNAIKTIGENTQYGSNTNRRDLEVLVQNAVAEYGDYINVRYLKPKGVGRKQIMSRAIDNSSRGVVLPMVWTNNKLGKAAIKHTNIGVPIHQLIQMFRDTIVKYSKNMIDNLFSQGYFPKDTTIDMLAFYDIEYLTNAIDKLEDPYARVQPFPAIGPDGTTWENVIVQFTIINKDGTEEVLEKPLAWIEFFYIVCISYADISTRRAVSTTRYPVDSALSAQFLKPVPITLHPRLLKTVKVFNTLYEDNFPLVTDYIRDNYDLKIFEQGYRLPASVMVGFNGDHDGDSISNKPINSVEAVDNVTKIHDELIYNYDYSGNYRRAVGKDGIQTFYSFTRNPKHSEKVKKIPNTHPFIRHIMDTNDGGLDVDILYKYMTRTDLDKEIEINQFDRVTIKRFGKDIETSVGILLVNKIVFYPLWNNKHFPYTNTVFTKKVLDYNMRLINQLVVEDKAKSSIVNDVVNMLLEFGLRFSAVFNASMTMSMMTPDKTFRKKKDDILNKAFKEYDETNDLSAVERAEHEILDYAREYYKDDDMYDIYLSGASADMDNDWKTMNVSMGPLPNLDGTKAIIVKEALGEGIPMSYTADLTNTATKGAYDRATNTALGGSLYKDIISGMGSIYAVWGDCGTKEGIETIASSKWDILNRYALVGGKSVLITLDNVDKFLNKKFIMRSPIKCKAKDGQFCSCCTGTYPFKVKSSKRVPIGMSTGEVATGILNMFMKSTHDLHISSFIIDDLNKYIYPKTTSLFEHKIDPIDGKLKVFVNEDIEWRIPNSSIDPEYNYYNVLAHGTIVTTKDKAYTIVLGTEVKTTPTAVIKPDYAEDRSLEAHTIFKYSKGDVFLLQNFAYRREMTVYKMFQLFLGGNVSNLLPVEMHLTTLNNTMKNNKKVNTSQLSLELILGSVTRDADDVTKPVRETGNKNYKFISVYELGATSSMFNSLFSGYATKAITINLAKSQKDQIKNPSPIEKAFRY